MPPQNTHRHRESFTLPDYRSIDLPLRTCTFVLGDIETSGFAIIYSYLRTFRPSLPRQAQPLSINVKAPYLRSVNATKLSTPPIVRFCFEIPASRYVLSPQRCNDFCRDKIIIFVDRSTGFRVPDRPWYYH